MLTQYFMYENFKTSQLDNCLVQNKRIGETIKLKRYPNILRWVNLPIAQGKTIHSLK